MKVKCLNCGNEFDLKSVYSGELGNYTVYPECDGSFDIDITKDNKLEFKAGYYEWNIFINDDCFYSFDGDIGESIDEDTTYEDLEYIIDDCICAMQLDLKENDRELLEEKYIPELKKQMLEKLSYHFGIEK